jgi:FkbM family methyltransferase
VAEVGVFLPEDSNVLGWILSGVRATLVEADPVTVARIREHFGARPNLTVHSAAVCDFHGEIRLRRAGPSTFIDGLDSPARVNDGYEPRPEDVFTAPAIRFDEVDDGTIDLLSIDVEGAEWWTIRHLRSRPSVISVETHGARYRNPHLSEIEAWMAAEGYEAWYLDRTDTVYTRGGAIRVTAADRACRSLARLRVGARRLRKRLLG